MERFSRDQKPAAKAPVSEARATAHPSSSPGAMASKVSNPPGWAAKLFIVLLVIASLVVASALAVGAFFDSTSDRLVKDGQYQAVFLDNGQVYFGRLDNTDRAYVRLTDIYYLQVNQPVQPDQVEPGDDPDADAADQQAQISLAKLGNELHGPEDEMFIHRDKIVFWENLKTDGQVTTAISEYVKNGSQDN